jgi:hypothetical protein
MTMNLLSTEARDLGLVPAAKALRRAKAEAKAKGATVYVPDERTDNLRYSVAPSGVVFWADGLVYFGG